MLRSEFRMRSLNIYSLLVLGDYCSSWRRSSPPPVTMPRYLHGYGTNHPAAVHFATRNTCEMSNEPRGDYEEEEED